MVPAILWVCHLRWQKLVKKCLLHTDLSHAAFAVAVASHLPVRNSIDPRGGGMRGHLSSSLHNWRNPVLIFSLESPTGLTQHVISPKHQLSHGCMWRGDPECHVLERRFRAVFSNLILLKSCISASFCPGEKTNAPHYPCKIPTVDLNLFKRHPAAITWLKPHTWIMWCYQIQEASQDPLTWQPVLTWERPKSRWLHMCDRRDGSLPLRGISRLHRLWSTTRWKTAPITSTNMQVRRVRNHKKTLPTRAGTF